MIGGDSEVTKKDDHREAVAHKEVVSAVNRLGPNTTKKNVCPRYSIVACCWVLTKVCLSVIDGCGSIHIYSKYYIDINNVYLSNSKTRFWTLHIQHMLALGRIQYIFGRPEGDHRTRRLCAVVIGFREIIWSAGFRFSWVDSIIGLYDDNRCDMVIACRILGMLCWTGGSILLFEF